MNDDDNAFPEGVDGCALETCSAIEWPASGKGVDEGYILRLQRRMRACALREPDLLAVFGMNRSSLNRLIADARSVFSREKTLEMVCVPNEGQSPRLHVLGDLHGDLFSFLEALSVGGQPSDSNRWVLAGDLVDRGSWGVELLILVFALKVWRPTAIKIIRGNHETTGCTSIYGFQTECLRKFGNENMYRNFMVTLRELPLAVVVQSLPPPSTSVAKEPQPTHGRAGTRKSERAKKSRTPNAGALEGWEMDLVGGERRVLVVHGGLWREHPERKGAMAIGSLRQLANEKRQVDDPEGTISEDVLWSDPGETTENGVRENSLRGAGIFYGKGAVDAFLRREKLCLLLRAHEGPDARAMRPEMNSMSEGFSVDSERQATIFSAAGYCGYSNKGCVATFYGLRPTSSELPEFTSFTSSKPLNASLFYEAGDERPATPRSV
jgi:serine/threonine-protein phosphatase 5